jgi:hypothetical protein
MLGRIVEYRKAHGEAASSFEMTPRLVYPVVFLQKVDRDCSKFYTFVQIYFWPPYKIEMFGLLVLERAVLRFVQAFDLEERWRSQWHPALLFALAKMQRDELSASTKRGLAAAQARGVKLGKRPGKWTAEVHSLHQSGTSPADIARKFGRSRQAVHNVPNGVPAVYTSPR